MKVSELFEVFDVAKSGIERVHIDYWDGNGKVLDREKGDNLPVLLKTQYGVYTLKSAFVQGVDLYMVVAE